MADVDVVFAQEFGWTPAQTDAMKLPAIFGILATMNTKRGLPRRMNAAEFEVWRKSHGATP